MAQPAFSAESEFNAARHHLTQGRLEEAETILTRLKAVIAPHPLVFEYLAFIAVQRQDLKRAVRQYRKAAKLDPSSAHVKIKLAEVLLATGADAEALKLAQGAVRKEPSNVSALNILAMTAAKAGRKDEAREHFSAAVQVDPSNFQAWHGLGRLRLGMGAWKEALDALTQANQLRPDHWQTLAYMGRAQTSVGRPELAIDVLKRAQSLASSPAEYCEVSVHLAEAYLRAQQLDRSLEVICEIDARAPGHPRGRTLHARILKEQGNHEGALAMIRSLPKDQEISDAEWFPNLLEAECLVSLDRHDEAAVAYETANRQQAKIYKRFGTDKNRFLQYALDATTLCSSSSDGGSPEQASPDAGKDLVFINGFPRSGTTLIDSILRMHSRVAIAEESNAAHSCWHAAEELIPGGRKSLASMNEDVAEKLRQHYWDQLGPNLSTDKMGRKVIDRHATGLLQAPLMKRLFPGAQFFFMLRHPCDVVLSAWFANFQPTDHTANYLTIEDTARFYDRMMTLHTALEDEMGVRAPTIRYEDLVADLRGTVTPILHAISLDWEDQLEAFHQSAHRPKRTASFNQVSKPLYTSATYRFEHYRPTLAPVMPILEPWIERFGYR
ncbi:MAG: tetratricopeptide repeat protein [Pseudomonadota bacterium]